MVESVLAYGFGVRMRFISKQVDRGAANRVGVAELVLAGGSIVIGLVLRRRFS